ncbi:MAG: sugar transferase [Butyrivibrio sp.]|nr:sugar transferase [Butyrivibrio sp.]
MTETVGNKNLISNEEEVLATFLRDRNLGKTNAKDKKVYPIDNLYTRFVKRGLDLLIGIPAFVVTLPFNVIFGICTYFDVGRPIFYKQTRIGKGGKPFTMIKFRNMNNKTDTDGKLLPASQRVTKFGKFMRKFSLDELLNFWSVIKGDMSIIGPRPMPVFFVDRMSERHKMRHVVRPGLECPYTIPKGSELSPYHWKFENDIWYVENVSFKTDIIMLIKLFRLTFNMANRSSHAGALAYFVGYDDEGHAVGKLIAEKKYGALLAEEEH